MPEQNAATTARMLRALLAMLAISSTSLLSACSDTPKSDDITSPSLSQAPNGGDDEEEDDADDDGRVYEQVEFLGNPLVSEVTIVKANHDRYNRTQPYNTAEFGAQSLAFINAFRGAQPAVAATLGAVLYPDMLIVESSKNPNTSGWLSWALANGWGGRNLSDDVVDAGLSAIFGEVIAAPSPYCKNGQLPLCTDNVPVNDKPFLKTFPYLASPTL